MPSAAAQLIINAVKSGQITPPGGMDAELWIAGLLLRAGLRSDIDESRFNIRTRFHYERVAIAAGVALATIIPLHTAEASPFVRTLKGGYIQPNTVFYMRTVRIDLESGLDVAGAAVTTNNGVTAGAAAAQAAFDHPVEKRRLLAGGHFDLKIGQREVVKDHRNLLYFPPGCGMTVDTAVATGGANAQNYGLAYSQNGLPSIGEAFPLYPQLISPSDKIEAFVKWQAALTPTYAWVLNVAYEGDEIFAQSK